MSDILLIDDERLPMKYYSRAFEMNNFEVKQCLDPDSALEYINRKKPKLKAIILDIMMLPGKKYSSEDTNNGLKTGILLYKDLRVIYPDTPIIFLTNVSNPEISKLPSETAATLEIVQKIEFPPFELVELVEKMINNSGTLEKV